MKGDIFGNIVKHENLINLAGSSNVDFIVFPELSLTGYEPELASKLAIENKEVIFQEFQKKSDEYNMTICVGLPTKSLSEIYLSMVIYRPHKSAMIYSKQFLHKDEQPYFSSGEKQVYCNFKNNKIAPAICYESLLPEHVENVFQNNTNIYAASVAKPKSGLEKALKHYPFIAKKYGLTVLLSNCIGHCDNFMSVGGSAVWNEKGELRGQLGEEEEGLLIYDINNDKCLMTNGE